MFRYIVAAATIVGAVAVDAENRLALRGANHAKISKKLGGWCGQAKGGFCDLNPLSGHFTCCKDPFTCHEGKCAEKTTTYTD